MLLSLGFFAVSTRLIIEGDFEGIYLLKGVNGKLFELKDDLLLGEYERILVKLELERVRAVFRAKDVHDPGRPYLTYKWSNKTGHGYIHDFMPDGSQFLICFGRFRDAKGEIPHGLFVGGGLPMSRYAHNEVKLNETGMAFFDGKEWHHIWCNANEVIAGGASPGNLIFPPSWKFLGSNVLYAHNNVVILHSKHQVDLDGVPVRIDRFVLHKAGDRFIVLVNKITNIGIADNSYYYVYGDEPWLGEFGTSAGNVGWVKDRLFNYEGSVDPNKYSYAGMFDRGNSVIHEDKTTYSGLANFIEWLGDVTPSLVYFSNKEGKFADESAKIPLSSKDNRVIFVQWGQRSLLPQQSDLLVTAIGMAGTDPKTGFPVKPKVILKREDMNFLMSRSD